MNHVNCPAVLVSAPASSQGKTLCTAALARAWKNRGFKVSAFKCRPDFLDPMVLEIATGQPVYNLDLGMCGEQDGLAQLYKAAQTADVMIVEGVMGLYDGVPSSADIALRFSLPVMLTIDASGMAQTFGAIVSGLLTYQAKLLPAGVLANQVGSAGHASLLRESLPAHLSWFGALPKNIDFALPERHLGLLCAAEITDIEMRIEAAAQALSASGALPLPPSVSFEAPPRLETPTLLAGKTIAIARDEAFCFIYPANIDCLQTLGARLQFFSPLNDAQLPNADAYWLPGGYPELHLAALSNNSSMRDALQLAFNANKPILAECGGMMALTQAINDMPVFGLLTGNCHIQTRFQGLGTQFVTLAEGEIAAHTFHYGTFNTSLTPQYIANSQLGTGERIYQYGCITASFLHFYFASNPRVAARLFLA